MSLHKKTSKGPTGESKTYIVYTCEFVFMLKGTVARDFLPLVFFHESTPYSPRIHTLKYFWILFRIRRNIRFLMLFCGVWYPAGLCSAGSDTPQDFVKRGIRPRRTLFCGVSDSAEQVYAIKCTQLCHCSVGSDTPQDLVLRGLIPRRVLFCGV